MLYFNVRVVSILAGPRLKQHFSQIFEIHDDDDDDAPVENIAPIPEPRVAESSTSRRYANSKPEGFIGATKKKIARGKPSSSKSSTSKPASSKAPYGKPSATNPKPSSTDTSRLPVYSYQEYVPRPPVVYVRKEEEVAEVLESLSG
jgi:hypothetical protein